MNNLEGEMSRLLEWASVGEDSSQGENAARSHAQRRSRVDPSHSAMERHEEVRDFLEGRADVHQKRAKRRELAESTAVKLPRESQATGPRRRTQREVSYLSDHRQAPRDPASVPASMIPDAFRILLESPFPHAEPQFYGMFGDSADWRHNPLTRQWESVLFPSKVPAGRRDVQLLHAWVSDMVTRLKRTAGSLPEESMLKEAQILFSVAFHEMIRQVSVHCLERGHLMGKIWWSEMELFQRLLQLRQADAQIVQREREAYQAEADMLRRQVEEMQAKLDAHGIL